MRQSIKIYLCPLQYYQIAADERHRPHPVNCMRSNEDPAGHFIGDGDYSLYQEWHARTACLKDLQAEILHSLVQRV